MKKQKANRKPYNNTEGKNKRKQKSHNWIGVVATAWDSLHYGSYTSNFIIAVAILLVTPYLGYQFMSNVRGMMVGFGIGVTVLFWVAWIAIIMAVPAKVAGDGPATKPDANNSGIRGTEPISTVKAQNIDNLTIRGVTFLNTSPSVFDLKNMTNARIEDSKVEVAPQAASDAKPIPANVAPTTQPEINAPNNQGNINTGNVNGNFSQSVTIVKPPVRSLSEAQKASLIEALRPFASDADINVFCSSADVESGNFSKQILEAVTAAGLKPKMTGWVQFFGNGPMVGVQIGVRDGKNPPPLAVALFVALKNANVVVSGAEYPQWPESSKDHVDLSIRLNPSNQ